MCVCTHVSVYIFIFIGTFICISTYIYIYMTSHVAVHLGDVLEEAGSDVEDVARVGSRKISTNRLTKNKQTGFDMRDLDRPESG